MTSPSNKAHPNVKIEEPVQVNLNQTKRLNDTSKPPPRSLEACLLGGGGTYDRKYADNSLDLPTGYHQDVDMGRKKLTSHDYLLPPVDHDLRKGDMDRASRIVTPKQ